MCCNSAYGARRDFSLKPQVAMARCDGVIRRRRPKSSLVAAARGGLSRAHCGLFCQRCSMGDLMLFAALWAVQHLGVAGRADGLDHLEDALADAAFADLVVGAHQLQRLALDQRILLLLERRAGLAEALAAAARHRPARQRVGRHLVEEVRNRHVEHLGELVKPARTDAVGAALVLLDLLEGEPDGRPELLLAHSQERAALTHARADMDVYRM